jgi:hypothetical protein
MLEYILQPETIIISSGGELIKENLRTYGPGLVSNFHVHEDFYDSEVSSHRGSPIGALKGRHSMVLIGHRLEGDNDIYLLQNWWKSKQFVEVDHNYLKRCNAT